MLRPLEGAGKSQQRKGKPALLTQKSNNLATIIIDMRHMARYGGMIRTIRHKGLKRLFEQDDPSGVNPEHADKLRDILATLHAAPTVAHMDLPGFRLHPLKGQMKGVWAVTVRANWRVIFRFDGPEDVDYVDYH
jgi:proteic killer suppression protein